MSVGLVLDNIRLVAESSGGIAVLRQLILDVAVTGRLVPQDSAEGNGAAVLLETKSLRDDLIAKRLVPPARHSTAICDVVDEFELPRGWCWARLDDVATYVQRGKGPSYAEAPTSTRVVSQKCVQWRGFDLSPARFVNESSLDGYGPERFLQPGDLLWNSTGTGTVGRVALFPGAELQTVADSHVTVVRLGHCIPEFVFTWLSSSYVQSVIALMTTGTTQQQELSTSVVRSVSVPVPPVGEQLRIVATVDELMGLCHELERTRQRCDNVSDALRSALLSHLADASTRIAKRDAWDALAERWSDLAAQPGVIAALRDAILKLAVRGQLVPQDPSDNPASCDIELARSKANAVGTRGQRRAERVNGTQTTGTELPEGWAWARVDDLFQVAGGLQKTPARQPQKNHYPYLRVANVQRGRLDLRDIERFELLDGELDRLRLLPGDLLVVEGNGSETEIGRCARWGGEIPDCVHQNHIIRCRPLVPGVEDYLLLFLNSPLGIQTMKALAVTTSGLYNLSVGKIRAITFPLAPAAERKQIVETVGQLSRQVDDLEARISLMETARTAFATSAVRAARR